MARPPLERLVHSARRRLVAQALLARLATYTAAALGVGLAWFVAEPLVLTDPPAGLRWAVLAGAAALAGIAAVVRTVRKAPPPLAVALEVDSRFDLRERVTSALALPFEARDTPMGRAVVADAEERVAPLRAGEQFPVRPPRSAAWLPVLAGGVALVAFVYHPVTDSPAWAEARQKDDDKDGPKVAGEPGGKVPPRPAARTKRPDDPDRGPKSDAVKELEADLDRLERQAREAGDTPAAAREKVTEITAAEDRAKQAERERFDKLARLEQQLRQLDKLDAADGFRDGPAKDFNDALARGDLKAAQEAVEELRKKAEAKQLDPKQQDQLAGQFDKMRDELQRLARNKEQQGKLDDLIAKAKREGRDPEALERERDRLKADAEQTKALEELARKLGDAGKSLKDGDSEQLARELERLAGQMRDLRGEAEDLKDLQDQIGRLQDLKDELTRGQGAGEKAGRGKAGADGQPGNGTGKAAGVRTATVGTGTGSGGPASGARPENADAETARGSEERQRSPFDVRGRKAYGGSVAGPAFTKRSPVEMSGAIEQAVQEAPEAIDAQRLSRDDRESVKEFFQSLGDQKR